MKKLIIRKNEKGLRLLDNPFTPSAGLSSHNHPHKQAQNCCFNGC